MQDIVCRGHDAQVNIVSENASLDLQVFPEKIRLAPVDSHMARPPAPEHRGAIAGQQLPETRVVEL